MRRLRTRPLADMIYHDRSIERSAFVCRRLAWPVPFHATARAVQASPDAVALWARRSAFWRQGQPLLVAECFLRSEEHTSELQSLMRISYAVFCLKKKKKKQTS